MPGTALVLGGGGITGIAWEIGLLAGLTAEGVDLTTADVVIGTSAGSVVGAQVASGTSIEDLYAAQLAGYGVEVAAHIGWALLLRYGLTLLRSRDPQRYRVRIGRLALRAKTVSPEQRLAVIASRLPSPNWPERALRVTAVDAASGEFQVFDRSSGVPLVDAVAASCAVPGVYPPITIGSGRYVDGGVRSATNADLADGYERVVILAPMTTGLGPLIGVHAHVEQLRPRSQVVAVSPDAAAVAAIGRNALDPARRVPAAEAGRAQAQSAVGEVRAVWQ
ncbi:MAG: patatin-like phospholipase family protein [Geodermatophilaceae bacterium]|nr:patatin-like phospholipase family protein [Geodermatophilaceae bacterium]